SKCPWVSFNQKPAHSTKPLPISSSPAHPSSLLRQRSHSTAASLHRQHRAFPISHSGLPDRQLVTKSTFCVTLPTPSSPASAPSSLTTRNSPTAANFLAGVRSFGSSSTLTSAPRSHRSSFGPPKTTFSSSPAPPHPAQRSPNSLATAPRS